MTTPYEGKSDDLFDFPEIEGLEDFGLVPPFREGADLSEFEEGQAPARKTIKAPAPKSPGSRHDEDDRSFVSEARPNPPLPADVADPDEDLFGFDELFSLEDDPYYNGTLSADGTPTSAHRQEPEPVVAAASAPAPSPAAAPSPALAPEPARAPVAGPAPERVTSASHSATSPQMQTEDLELQMGAPRPGVAPDHGHARRLGALDHAPNGAALDRGPRILLPEDVPYGGSSARDTRMIWALVACFLIVNTGIFWLAHLASSNVNQSLTNATGIIAGAIANASQKPPVYGAAPAPATVVEHTVEERLKPGEKELEQPPPTRRAEPWIDPRNYEGTHEFAVGRAKALLTDGRFEDARRLLNHVLANQARVPLAPRLREEIDYLIPLTYYEQGLATAPQEDSR